MLSPLETGTTRGRRRERARSRETGPSRGYLAPAGGARRRRSQLAGQPARRGRARPLHLIHGGAVPDSARQERHCQDRHRGRRRNAGRDDLGSGRARARSSGGRRVCGEHPVPAVVGDVIRAQARSASCVPAASRKHRHAAAACQPGTRTCYRLCCAQPCGSLVQNGAGPVRTLGKCWGSRCRAAPVTGPSPGRARSAPCGWRKNRNCPHATP